jgi:hypothetical protein
MPGAIPGPPSFSPGWSPATMLILWGAMSAAAAGYAIHLSIRDRDPLPAVACVGALICTLNEPIYDILGKLVYAHVPSSYVAYTAFGRAIPLALVVGYIPWVGLAPYLLLKQFEAGISRRRLHVIALGLNASVAALEVLNALTLHMWRYYGGDSARGVLSGGIIQMSAMPLLAALLYFMLGDQAKGWWRVLLGLIVPVISLPMVFASTTLPLYFTNYARVAGWVHWVGAAASAALCVCAVRTITGLVARWQQRAPIPPAPQPATPAGEPAMPAGAGAAVTGYAAALGD